MDLFAMLDNELKMNNITDEEEIQKHFYRRCGQIFAFNPEAIFGTEEYRESLRNFRLNIRNIQIYEINCHMWAYLIVDLLKAKGIDAEVKEALSHKDGKKHALVVSHLKKGDFLLDLMADFKDIMRVKYGFTTIFPKKIIKNPLNESLNASFKQYITFENFREQVIKTLNCDNKEESQERKNYRVLKCIEGIVNNPIFESRNIDFVSGIQFINELIEGIIKNKKPKNTFYTNKEQNLYVKVYSLKTEGGNKCFFAYQKEGNCYKLREVSIDKIEELEEKSNNTRGLVLIKKDKQLRVAG